MHQLLSRYYKDELQQFTKENSQVSYTASYISQSGYYN